MDLSPVWYVVRNDVYVVWGTLLAFVIVLAILLIILGGSYPEKWRPAGWRQPPKSSSFE